MWVILSPNLCDKNAEKAIGAGRGEGRGERGEEERKGKGGRGRRPSSNSPKWTSV